MSIEPPIEGPEQAPTPPPDATPPPSYEAPPAPPEAPAPYAYAPPPGAPMAAAPRRRGRGPLIAIAGVVIIVIVAVLGYGVAGYAYAQGRLSSARNAYNTVVDHENSYTDAMNSFQGKMTNADLNTSTDAEIQQKKSLVTQFGATSQQAQTQIAGDDASLAKADSDLKANSWLTVISKSDLDTASTKIGHMRNALKDAKQVMGDYVGVANFYSVFYDVRLDVDALDTAFKDQSLTNIAASLGKIKTDAAKAMQLDKSPGIAPEMDGYLKAVTSLSNDLAALLDAAAKQDQAAFDAAEAAAEKDGTSADSYDFAKMDQTTQAFFKPLVDDYNSEINKANNT